MAGCATCSSRLILLVIDYATLFSSVIGNVRGAHQTKISFFTLFAKQCLLHRSVECVVKRSCASHKRSVQKKSGTGALLQGELMLHHNKQDSVE